jgi:hypothetical protein
MKSVIVISDTHIGSNAGLCSSGGFQLPDDNLYDQNRYQETTWRYWEHFWKKWVPKTIGKSKDVRVVINGDLIDGFHHDTVNIMSASLPYQEFAAKKVLGELDHYDGLYVVRGTDAHAGIGAGSEEKIARDIGARKCDEESGNYSDYQLWITVDKVPFNFAHHISTTSSAAYESSAPMRELVTTFVEAAQWGRPMPRIIVRSHRHRFIPVAVPSIHGRIRVIITPGWQLRTPFVERIDRMRMPHIGGVIFKVEDDECQDIEKIYPLPMPKPIQI